MTSQAYSELIRYKQWADGGLLDVIAANLDTVDAPDAEILLRILDHIFVVDQIFQYHLRGLPHAFEAPRSRNLPAFHVLASGMKGMDDWYVSHVDGLADSDFDQSLDFVFTNGSPAHMRCGEILLHVCLHGTYHRGNAGVVLQKHGVAPNDDRMTDFLEQGFSSAVAADRQTGDRHGAGE